MSQTRYRDQLADYKTAPSPNANSIQNQSIKVTFKKKSFHFWCWRANDIALLMRSLCHNNIPTTLSAANSLVADPAGAKDSQSVSRCWCCFDSRTSLMSGIPVMHGENRYMPLATWQSSNAPFIWSFWFPSTPRRELFLLLFVFFNLTHAQVYK